MSNDFKPFGGLGMATQHEETDSVEMLGEYDVPGFEVPEGTFFAKVKKPTKVDLMTLDELYAKAVEVGKLNPSIRKGIIAKEDFSIIQPRFCDIACGLCKASRRPKQVRLQSGKVDIVIVQDHNALAQMYKSSEQMESIYRDIIGYLAMRHFQGLNHAVLNSLKCVPTTPDLRGQVVTTTKVNACSPYLQEELRRINPKVIIVLTTNSLKQFGLKKSCSSNRGEFYKTEHGPVVITLHPKALTMIRQNASGKEWGPDYLEVLDRDFEKAAKIARGDMKIVSLKEALAEASTRIRIARSMDDVKEMFGILNSLPISKIVSFDLETTSLDAWSSDARIITAQFGYTEPETGIIKALVIPLWHRLNTWFDPDEAWIYVSEVLLSQRPKVGHNIKFDIIFTFVTTGVRVVNAAFDTLLLLHAINSGLKNNYGLKKAVWDFLPETGLGGYEDQLPALTRAKKIEEDDGDDAEDIIEDC